MEGTDPTRVTDVELAGAEVYVEATRSAVYGRWYVLADDSVIYERPRRERSPALIPAHTLRNSTSWTRETPTSP